MMAKIWSLCQSFQFNEDMSKMPQGRATFSAWESYKRKTQLCPFSSVFSTHIQMPYFWNNTGNTLIAVLCNKQL